jgi:hypothetical protein
MFLKNNDENVFHLRMQICLLLLLCAKAFKTYATNEILEDATRKFVWLIKQLLYSQTQFQKLAKSTFSSIHILFFTINFETSYLIYLEKILFLIFLIMTVTPCLQCCPINGLYTKTKYSSRWKYLIH